MAPLRNLVFDLGGVLYAIDPPRATRKLLGFMPESARKTPEAWFLEGQALFDALEAGHISPAEFRDQLRNSHGLQASDAAIDTAWNSLLIGVLPGRAEAIADLKGRYRLILLSNTNLIHQIALRDECAPLFAHFERLFFSYEMGLRKPAPIIYTTALQEMGMDPAESLFIDDNRDNVRGAEDAGLRGYHLAAHSDIAWDALMESLAKKDT